MATVRVSVRVIVRVKERVILRLSRVGLGVRVRVRVKESAHGHMSVEILTLVSTLTYPDLIPDLNLYCNRHRNRPRKAS